MDQDGTEVALGRPLCVRWGPSCPLPKKGAQPQFSAHVRCGQSGGWIKMPLGMEVGLGPGDIVLDGDPAPPKEGTDPQFWAYVYCGQTAGWIKMMPLGVEVSLGPSHIVLGGHPPPPLQRCTAPNFRLMPVVAKRLDGSRCHLVGR